jgi:hypothetical protein
MSGCACGTSGGKPLQSDTPLAEMMWQKREIENYLCQEHVPIAYARHDQADDLFGRAEATRREQVMRECIAEVTAALATLGRPSAWSDDIKASDELLNPVFERFFKKLGLPNLLRKTDYHVLAGLVSKEKLAPEITAKLDIVLAVANKARPNAVILNQQGPWSYGVLANHIWSFAGEGSRADVNRTFLQPFVSYTTKTFTTFGANTESTYDWEREQLLIPLNVAVQQLLKVGKQPVALQIAGRYYAEGFSGAPEWGLRFQLTFLFPK